MIWSTMYVASPPAPAWHSLYQIQDADTGKVVLRRMNWYYHYTLKEYHEELATADQEFANAIARLIQDACAYFYADDADYTPFEGVSSIIVSDDEVRERIQRGNSGELKREADARSKLQYPIPELPLEIQRALIQRIDQLKADTKYQRMGIVIPQEQAEAAIAALSPSPAP